MKTNLTTYHVLPPLKGHEIELARDAEQLLERGICTDIAFMMTLVPESDPPVDKANILAERFIAFRDAFQGDPSRVGILAQATIGHGWEPDEPASFQTIIRPDGSAAYQMCPLDVAFRDYIRKAFTTLAALQPAFLMIDDDFRMLSGRNGCYCPLHLDAIRQASGETFDRESLLARLREDASMAKAFDQVLLDSLMTLASDIREAIDAVNPTIPGSFCACYGDIRHAIPLSQKLAGNDNPPMVRINNARYLCPEMRSFPIRMYHGAVQIAALGNDITVLAETDPYPHNRYSTGANLLHSHYTGSLFEGCHGAKHWLTRIETYQPASGTCYRSILEEHHEFYETLFQSVQASEPTDYVAVALPSSPYFNPAPDQGDNSGATKTWGQLLGVMGLPCNYAKVNELPAMMTGEEAALFSDRDIETLLQNGVLLEGEAAEILCQRGFSNDLGVDAEPWEGKRVSGECWEGTTLCPSHRYTKLTVTHPETRIGATLTHRQSGVSESVMELGAALTLFENARGGRVVILSGSLNAQHAMASFGYYDEDRKRQLVAMLSWITRAELPFYYPGDAEVYLKLRRFHDGRYLLGLFNLGHDPLETIPLLSSHKLTVVESLTAEGTWQNVCYEKDRLHTSLLPAQPKVLRITCQPNV